jgi:nucleoside 2-deoxyribosyltransferase
MKTKVFLICSVRGVAEEQRLVQEEYVKMLELSGYVVHYPPRDTNQKGSSIEVNTQNVNAIKSADEVHVWYNPNSIGTHFDLGATFALGKRMVVAHNIDPLPQGKSYARLINEYVRRQQ